MRWPWSNDDDSRRQPQPPILSLEYWSDPKNYLTARVLIPASILAAGSLGLIHVYRAYVRRIPESSQIYPSFFRKRSLFGKVTSVGDGDNFRLYHTPGGRLQGWEWFPRRKVPTDSKELKDRTVHIRIAGVDAPELGHWGNIAQPHAAESLEWLRKYLLGRRVRAFIYRRDQYDRIVGSVKVWRGFRRRDLGLEMLKAGVAAVYEAKTGAEFGKMESKYRMAEAIAKAQKKGMWGQKGPYESPGAYKKAMKDANAEQAASGSGTTPSPATGASKGITNKPSSSGAGSTARSGAKGGIVVVGRAKPMASKITASSAAAKRNKP